MSAEMTNSFCTCAAVRQVSRHVTQFYDQCLAPFGLRVTQFSILSRLQRGGPKSINSLASELLMDRTTLARNLRPLEREGLLKMAANETDRRSRVLTVTAAGAKRVERAREGWRKAQNHFEHAYGGKRTAALRELLEAVVHTELSVNRAQASSKTGARVQQR